MIGMKKSNRGGNRAGAGRKPLGDKNLRRHNVMLSDAHVERAEEIGEGNLSLGVRRAIEKANK